MERIDAYNHYTEYTYKLVTFLFGALRVRRCVTVRYVSALEVFLLSYLLIILGLYNC